MKKSDQRNGKWHNLLLSWQKEVLEIWSSNRERWNYLELDDVSELRFREPNHAGIDDLKDRCGFLDREIISFYRVTNGWPLWLGSFGVGVLSVDRVGLFAELDPDGHRIATATAPSTRVVAPEWDVSLSQYDLRQAVLLTEYPAREMVLSLFTGETVLYHFDGMEIFCDFYDYMSCDKERVKRSIVEMLGKESE